MPDIEEEIIMAWEAGIIVWVGDQWVPRSALEES